LAVEALVAAGDLPVRGLNWLLDAVETGRFRRPSPIGFYFAKLWYQEKLYPIIFTASALGRATQRWAGSADRSPAKSHQALPTDPEIKQPCP
jgi:squalene-hopene/tetraprenyl-beta-curcumene cyclase